MSSLVVRCQVSRPAVVCAKKSIFAGRTMPSTHLRITTKQSPRQVTTMGIFGLGAPELAVIAGVVLLIYGPAKLPEVGKTLGKTVKSFQGAAKEFEKELKEGLNDEDPKPPNGEAKQ